ncbi:hypothetical protein HanRHA438_Chr14g0672721 [Helianthus annuus]|nr:hypothetical protein HanRHA438_Chr14g0672721 [Helianthus annuus]
MTSKRTVRFGFRSWFGAWLNSGSRRFCSRSRLVSGSSSRVDFSIFPRALFKKSSYATNVDSRRESRIKLGWI